MEKPQQLARALLLFRLAVLSLMPLGGCGDRETNASAQSGLSAGDAPPQTAVESTLTSEPSSNVEQTAAPADQKLDQPRSFVQQLEGSPFASANPSLRERYADALVALRIGNYAGVTNALKDLPTTDPLTQEQYQAIQDLMQKAALAAQQSTTN